MEAWHHRYYVNGNVYTVGCVFFLCRKQDIESVFQYRTLWSLIARAMREEKLWRCLFHPLISVGINIVVVGVVLVVLITTMICTVVVVSVLHRR